MKAAAPFLNGQANAAAPQPVRIIAVGVRGLTWSVLIQVALMLLGFQRFADGLRSDVRELKASSDQRLDAIDRRLSKLDGVPR